jgi:hypothetical protein
MTKSKHPNIALSSSEQVSLNGNVSNLYSGDHWFESQISSAKYGLALLEEEYRIKAFGNFGPKRHQLREDEEGWVMILIYTFSPNITMMKSNFVGRVARIGTLEMGTEF